MYIRKIRRCILVNNVCFYAALGFQVVFVIHSIKSASLNIYHTFIKPQQEEEEEEEEVLSHMTEALSLLMKRVSWQNGLTRTTLLPL